MDLTMVIRYVHVLQISIKNLFLSVTEKAILHSSR